MTKNYLQTKSLSICVTERPDLLHMPVLLLLNDKHLCVLVSSNEI